MKIILRKDNILLLIYVVAVSVYTLPISSIKIFNFSLTILFYFNVVFILLGMLHAYTLGDYKSFFIIVFISAIAFIICLFNGTHLQNLSIFLSLIIGMYYTTSISYSRDYYKIICIVGLIYNVISLIYCPNYFEQWENNAENMINPNTIGIMNLFYAIIVNSYIHLFYKQSSQKGEINRYKKRIFFISYNTIILFILFSYRGRTSQSALLFFLVIFAFLKEGVVKKPKLLCTMVGILIVGGVFFPILYINMPKSIMNWIATTTGKPYFSGREVIWSRFLAALANMKNLLIGPGSWRKAEYTTLWASRRVYSMHNNYLDILLCFGCLGLIMFLSFTLWRIYHLSKETKMKNYVCLIGYVAFLVLGYSENTFVYAFFVVLFNVLLGMSLYNE